jgi:hypothetical protein
MNPKIFLALVFGLVFWLSAPPSLEAGTLDEMGTAVDNHYASGAISDADVKGTLSDIVNNAKATSDAQAQTAYRTSFIDVVEAFRGAGISSAAADDLVTKAQP